MRLTWALPLILLACGDNNGTPDAQRRSDASFDAPPPACSYTEAADSTNDDFFGNGTAEMTNLTFTGAKTTICGTFENSHYEQAQMLIDVDTYRITVPQQTSAIVSITAPGAEAINTVLVEIYGMTTSTDEVGKFMGTFATASASLPPGEYNITVSSFHESAPTAGIDYKVVLAIDNPATRCPKSTATTGIYTESQDGITADGNDIYEVRYSSTPRRQFTANALDIVEPTGISAAPGSSHRITGTNITPTVAPVSWGDFYQDRDTYQITMGANTNQLSLRLNWTGPTMDMDMLVFPMAQLNDFADAYYNRNGEDEFLTTAVIPGMSYWVFVAADDASTGQPVTYDLTVCGATFAP